MSHTLLGIEWTPVWNHTLLESKCRPIYLTCVVRTRSPLVAPLKFEVAIYAMAPSLLVAHPSTSVKPDPRCTVWSREHGLNITSDPQTSYGLGLPSSEFALDKQWGLVSLSLVAPGATLPDLVWNYYPPTTTIQERGYFRVTTNHVYRFELEFAESVQKRMDSGEWTVSTHISTKHFRNGRYNRDKCFEYTNRLYPGSNVRTVVMNKTPMSYVDPLPCTVHKQGWSFKTPVAASTDTKHVPASAQTLAQGPAAATPPAPNAATSATVQTAAVGPVASDCKSIDPVAAHIKNCRSRYAVDAVARYTVELYQTMSRLVPFLADAKRVCVTTPSAIVSTRAIALCVKDLVALWTRVIDKAPGKLDAVTFQTNAHQLLVRAQTLYCHFKLLFYEQLSTH